MIQKRWYSRKIVNNLMNCYNRASSYDRDEGMRWYTNARLLAEELSKKYKVPLVATAGVIAALSPGAAWDRNVEDARVFLDEWFKGARGKRLPLVGSYGWRNILKAERCANGENPWDVLGGLKVRAFYACIVDPMNKEWVCVDRHAKSAALGEKIPEDKATVRDGEFKLLEKHYKWCAEKVAVIPNQFQAVVWVTWRRLGGVLEQEDIPF